MACAEIVSVAIYPPVGFARVGNSPNEFFYGPEVLGAPQVDPDLFRDPSGAIKRQAARFRVYGLNAAGEVICELNQTNPDVQEIVWTAQLANQKAAWYEFIQALDIPASADGKIVSKRRNADVTERDQLTIDGGTRSICGLNVNPQGEEAIYAFDHGAFFGKQVYLGELRTDQQGNLIVLGGRGHSASAHGKPLTTFADNDDWHDDTADGPIEAVVKLSDGRVLQATHAWVIVAPPDYAPGTNSIMTGYDLLFEVAMQLDSTLAPAKPRFSSEIYPLLSRFSQLQWVNAGFARSFGWGSPSDFNNPELIARLGDPSAASEPLRQAVLAQMRNPSNPYIDPEGLPLFYGDAITLNTKTTDPQEWQAILPSQYRWLEQWANGDFIADGLPVVRPWEQLDPAEQAYNLTRAALDATLGGPFHPGCEFTWPLRHTSMYVAPFRLKRRTSPEPDWGDTLDAATALAPDGMLYASAAGAITRWMAVPWQTDTSSCLSAYMGYAGTYLPTFWPARVPNDVLSQESYQIIMNPDATPEERAQAFAPTARRKWLRGMVYTESIPPGHIPTVPAITKFTNEWDTVGIIIAQTGPEHSASFPQTLWVETGRHVEAQAPQLTRSLAAEPETDLVDSDLNWPQQRLKRGRKNAAEANND
ncbi:MAG: LodA/GoxA family CTQ-dependent oxidase [Chloroflexi bacterium]|nr:LodA/GoxA family CTQ-dependent oxidase [Chloroflexota bacterium]